MSVTQITDMGPSRTIMICLCLLLTLATPIEGYPRIVESAFRPSDYRSIADNDYFPWWPWQSKRSYDTEPMSDVIIGDDVDDEPILLERRGFFGQSRRPSNRWSSLRQVTPYYHYSGEGTNYLSARPVSDAKIFPSSWFGRGWYNRAYPQTGSYVKRGSLWDSEFDYRK